MQVECRATNQSDIVILRGAVSRSLFSRIAAQQKHRRTMSPNSDALRPGRLASQPDAVTTILQ